MRGEEFSSCTPGRPEMIEEKVDGVLAGMIQQWHQRDETQAHHRRPVAHQLRVLLEAGLVQEVRGLMDHRVDDHRRQRQGRDGLEDCSVGHRARDVLAAAVLLVLPIPRQASVNNNVGTSDAVGQVHLPIFEHRAQRLPHVRGVGDVTLGGNQQSLRTRQVGQVPEGSLLQLFCVHLCRVCASTGKEALDGRHCKLCTLHWLE
mmetsp:Transcript_101195/g.241269  ORF Transcript_101195/g.241269 Transcript_101195/m.241269 type:complete len:203 (+) Transcript_101195:75-683(+)